MLSDLEQMDADLRDWPGARGRRAGRWLRGVRSRWERLIRQSTCSSGTAAWSSRRSCLPSEEHYLHSERAYGRIYR